MNHYQVLLSHKKVKQYIKQYLKGLLLVIYSSDVSKFEEESDFFCAKPILSVKNDVKFSGIGIKTKELETTNHFPNTVIEKFEVVKPRIADIKNKPECLNGVGNTMVNQSISTENHCASTNSSTTLSNNQIVANSSSNSINNYGWKLNFEMKYEEDIRQQFYPSKLNEICDDIQEIGMYTLQMRTPTTFFCLLRCSRFINIGSCKEHAAGSKHLKRKRMFKVSNTGLLV